jgi:hypothetical protein
MRALALAGAALPLASLAVVLVSRGPGLEVFSGPDLERWRAAVDALLLFTLLICVFAPAAGVAIAASSRERQPDPLAPPHGVRRSLRMAARLMAATLPGIAISAAATMLMMRGMPGVGQVASASHVTLALAAIAFGLLGAWAGVVLAHPLDAAGAAIAASLVLATAVLLAGPIIDGLPRWAVDAALVASPVVSVAAAANIDLFRTELLYQLSPLASLGFGYPSWVTSCLLYGAAAAVCVSGTARAISRASTSFED